MDALIPLILAVLEAVLPLIGKRAGATGKVVELLAGLVPLVVNTAKDLLPIVQSMIHDLTTSDDVTPDDLAKLREMNRIVDEAFDAAVQEKLGE